MGNMADAFNKAGIKPSDFPEVEIDTKRIEFDLQIEFLEKWAKLLLRNAPEKEQYKFATDNGFLSANHLKLYMLITGEIAELHFELDSLEDFYEEHAARERKKYIESEIKEKEKMAANIKSIPYYRIVMRQLGQKDISPYGEDLLRTRLKDSFPIRY